MKKININYNETFASKHSRDYYRGQSFHFSGKWMVGAHYLSDDYNVDFVVHGQVLLACAKSHLSTLENEPKEFIKDERGTIIGVVSQYWDFVLSGIQGKVPGVRINEENFHWEICEDITVPESEQVWEDTGVKAKMQLQDLTPEEIRILQQPGIDVVTDFVEHTITQTTGQNIDKLMSQKAVTDELNKKATVSQLTVAINNEVSRANDLYATKATVNTLAEDMQECCDEVKASIRTVNTDLDTETEQRQDDVANLQAQIDALSLGVKVTVSCSPSVGYKESSTNLTVRVSVNEITPTSITLYAGDIAPQNIIATIENSQTLTWTQGVNFGTDNSKIFNAVATYKDMILKGSATFNARYPIYCGFSNTSWYDVVNNANKLSARTSAAGTYPTKISTINNAKFYIIYETDLAELHNFTMGGAPYVMNYQIIDYSVATGHIYRVYESGAIYSIGSEVSITAS